LRPQEGLLRQRGDGRLAHLGVVERLVQVVEARHVLQAEVGVLGQLDVGVGLGGLVVVEAQLLDDVDLALLQRVDLGLRVTQRQVPFDPVDNTCLPPAVPDGGSLRGTYLVFLRYTALSPGLNSSRLKM
jgi:hypothetical protein